MNSARILSWFLLPVLAAAFSPRPALAAASADPPSAAAANYESHEGRKGPYMSLSLGSDGSATLTEDPGSGAMVRFGKWSESGEQVVLKFDSEAGKPAARSMIFRRDGDQLQATTWDRAFWGKITPPPMKKNTGVKGSYWFTTTR